MVSPMAQGTMLMFCAGGRAAAADEVGAWR